MAGRATNGSVHLPTERHCVYVRLVAFVICVVIVLVFVVCVIVIRDWSRSRSGNRCRDRVGFVRCTGDGERQERDKPKYNPSLMREMHDALFVCDSSLCVGINST